MAYQSAKVGVSANAGQLLINDLANGDRIAEHIISLEKGQIIKNTHHYRDMKQRIKTLEDALEQQLGDSAKQRLCALLGSPYKSMQVYFYQRVTGIGITNKNLQVNAS